MIGYCCINMTLRDNHLVNRTMKKKTFQDKGLLLCSDLIKKNLSDLLIILQWNLKNDILLYRMSSDMFPWVSEYDISKLPDFITIQKHLIDIGNFIKTNNMRVSFHPGPFNVLGSENQIVVEKTINELTKHAEIMSFMNLSETHYFPINIHLSAIKPNKQTIANNFIRNYNKLPNIVKTRLTIENDDSETEYTPKELYELIYLQTGIPITFDQFHFVCGKQDETLQEALNRSLTTWAGVTPLTHHSSSKRIESNDEKIRKSAHADYIYEKIETFGNIFDTDIEAKTKELAVLKYKKDFM